MTVERCARRGIWIVVGCSAACSLVRPLDELDPAPQDALASDVRDESFVRDEDVTSDTDAMIGPGGSRTRRGETTVIANGGAPVAPVEDAVPPIAGNGGAGDGSRDEGGYRQDAGSLGSGEVSITGGGGRSGDAGSECRIDADCAEGRCLGAGAGCAPCPSDMQLVRFPDDGTAFCIDRLEVTQAQYQAFLDEVGSARPDAARPPCGSSGTLQPSDSGECAGAFAPDVTPGHPVSCVDACDAVGYCSWMGKRLCGGKGGLIIPVNFWALPNMDEWQLACQEETTRSYPYGPRFEPGACNVASDALVDTGASPACATPGGVLDLSGNVAEWTDYCGAMNGEPHCAVRGGSFVHRDTAAVGCNRQATDGIDPVLAPSIFTQARHIGIRCCMD